MSSQTQKALTLTEKYGDLVVATIPKYKPGKGEVLIKVQAASLNPIDWKIKKYGLAFTEFPAILGVDAAGDIEEVGEGVSEFKKGDKVFGQCQFINDRAGFQQYVLMLAATTAKIPFNFSYDEASTIPVALSTPYVAFFNESPHGFGLDPPVNLSARGKYAGVPVVILGGAGSVGQTAIQIAKISGFSPIITTASKNNTEFLTTLGADAVFDRHLEAEALSREILKVTSKPITLVYDSVGLQSTQKIGASLLAPGGKLATVLDSELNDDDLKGGKTVVRVVAILGLPQNIGLLSTFYHDHVSDWLAQGLIKPNRVEVLPGGLEGIKAGFERMERDEVSRLKLVAHPQETA